MFMWICWPTSFSHESFKLIFAYIMIATLIDRGVMLREAYVLGRYSRNSISRTRRDPKKNSTYRVFELGKMA